MLQVLQAALACTGPAAATAAHSAPLIQTSLAAFKHPPARWQSKLTLAPPPLEYTVISANWSRERSCTQGTASQKLQCTQGRGSNSGEGQLGKHDMRTAVHPGHRQPAAEQRLLSRAAGTLAER